MRKRISAIAIALALSTAACNDVGDCPKGGIAPGGACTGDSLQCAYDLPSPTAACDGTTTTFATSCVCTKGSWSCPSAIACPAAGTDGGDDASADAGDDASDP